MIFIKTLKNTNQKRNVDEMISDLLTHKKINQIVAELFTKHFSRFYYTILFCCAKKN